MFLTEKLSISLDLNQFTQTWLRLHLLTNLTMIGGCLIFVALFLVYPCFFVGEQAVSDRCVVLVDVYVQFYN